MLWTVGARFHLDGADWTIPRLKFWQKGADEIYKEEQSEIARIKKEAGSGRG